MLATRGAHIVAAARGDNAAATVEAITGAGGKRGVGVARRHRHGVGGGVGRGSDDRHGRIDILVNNAGIARDQLMLRMKREEWDDVIATNLTAAFTCVHAVLRPMIKRRAGRIISISSVVGQMGNPGRQTTQRRKPD